MEKVAAYIDKQYSRYLNYPFFEKYKQVIIYFVFGSTAAFVDLAVYLFLFNVLEIIAVISTIISITLATIVGFFLNAIINFRIYDKLLLRFFSYASVSVVGMVISSSMLFLFHDIQGFNGNVIKIVSLPIIFIVQYTLNSKISFRKKRESLETVHAK